MATMSEALETVLLAERTNLLAFVRKKTLIPS